MIKNIQLSFMVLQIAFLVVAVIVAVVVFAVAIELRHLMKKYNIGWLQYFA